MGAVAVLLAAAEADDVRGVVVDNVGAIARPDYWAHVRSFLEENGL